MKITPYLHFSGQAAEAIALYEKALGVKALVHRYKDTPESEGYAPPEGTEEYIMHACLDEKLFLCDVLSSDACEFSGAMSVCVTLGSAEKVKEAFDVLKQGGEIGMEPQQTFWAKCFSSLEDKFGVSWMLQCE